MDDILPKTILWWIVAVDIPVFSSILLMITRTRRHFDERQDMIREDLAAHKLEVARSYVSNDQLKDLESRVIAHLIRIETKLDRTALKAHALHLFPQSQPKGD